MTRVSTAIAKHPILASSLVGYSVFATGDGMAQLLERPDQDWNPRRSLSIGLLGILQNGFLLRFWYRVLDTFVTPKHDLVSVIKKIACDEAVFAPQLAASYLATSAYIQHPGDWQMVRRRVKEKLFQTWQNDLKLWPAANFVGFSFVPRPIRPIYASGVQLVWQCYLSTVGFSEHGTDDSVLDDGPQ